MYLLNTFNTSAAFNNINFTSAMERPPEIVSEVKDIMEHTEDEHPILICAMVGVLAALLSIFILYAIKLCFCRIICRRHSYPRRRTHALVYEGKLTPIPRGSKQRSLRIDGITNRNKPAPATLKGQRMIDFDAPSKAPTEKETTKLHGTAFTKQSTSVSMSSSLQTAINPFDGESGDEYEEEIHLA